MVGDDCQGLLADFGLAILGDDTQGKDTSTGTNGSISWMAPEWFKNLQRRTPEMDVYSFGCICYMVGLFILYHVAFVEALQLALYRSSYVCQRDQC
jgi:serine/threonine protein kinase